MIHSNTISDWIKGFEAIISSETVHHLINNYSIDDACKERIRQIDYTNYGSFFHYKGNSYYTLTPAAELSRYITHYGQTNDTTLLKWFILIYSIASVNDIYKSHIYQYVDDRIKALWTVPEDTYLDYFDRRRRESNLNIPHLLDGILDIGSILSGTTDRNSGEFRHGVVLFCLSAGYHWHNQRKYVSEDILNRDNEMPMTLSYAYYVSILTGKDFYEAFSELLKSNGMKNSMDDIIIMVKAEKAKQKLSIEREKLFNTLTFCENNIKKEQAIIDITSEAYGSEVSKEELDKRVTKCTNDTFIRVLRKAEDILGVELHINNTL